MGVCATSWNKGLARPLAGWTVGLVLLFGGPPSATAAVDKQPPPSPTNQLTSLVLREAAPGVRLDATASGPLVWTQYREPSGELIVELVNTVPAAGVGDIQQAAGLVESVQVESLPAGDRPMTRLRIATREDAVHELALAGSTLQLSLHPTVAPSTAEVVAFEPLPNVAEPAEERAAMAPTEDERPASEPQAEPTSDVDLDTLAVTESIASAPAAAPRRSFASFGSADEPLAGPQPMGIVATRLERVELMPLDGGTEAAVTGDGEFRYSTFWLADPPRFVVDLAGVVNLNRLGAVPWGGETVERVRVAQFKSHPEPVTRVVFDLLPAAEPPVMGRAEDGLRVFFAHAGSTASLPAANEVTSVRPATAPVAAPPLPVATVADTHEAPPVRAQPDESMQGGAPELSTGNVPILPAREGVELPASPASRGTPTAPPLAEPTDVAYFEALQVTDDEVSPKEASPEAPKYEALEFTQSGKVYTGEPISFSLRDADIKEVLRSFAKISGLNVIVQPGVAGSVTVELEQVPWDQALEQILKINGLWYELDGNIMRIAPRSVLAAEAKQELERQQAAALSIPLRTVIKRVSYVTANEVSTLLSGSGRAGLLSQRGTVTVHAGSNTLIIKELPSFMDAVLAIITEIDQPEPQVMIESRIIETTKNFSRSLGIAWGVDGVADNLHGNATGLQFPNNISGSGAIDLLTGGSNVLLGLNMGNVLNTFTLNAQLQAAEAEGLINVLSAPKVTVLNNEQAEIQSGLQIPIQTVSNNTVTVQFVNATLRLNVTPQVTAEGTVMMRINVQKREPQLAFAVVGASNAPIATREARTRVIVRDGGTAVIGGIYQVSTDEGQDRVPGLANIPILGRLFKNNRRNDRNEELLIFITPRVIKL